MPNKDSFTFSDKLKKSKSLPLSKRIPSRVGGDGKAKRTLIQRAQRDLPFIIVAAAALLLLPLLSRNSGTEGPGGDNLGYDNFIGDSYDYPASGDSDIVPTTGYRNPMDYIITNKSGRDTSLADSYDSDDTSSLIGNAAHNYQAQQPNISAYKDNAKKSIRNAIQRKATSTGALRNRAMSFNAGNAGLQRSLAIGGAPTTTGAAAAARAGVRPVALQPLSSAGGGRVLTGEGLYAEAARSLGALNQGSAKQALFDAQLRDVDGSPLGAAGDPRKSAARIGSQGTVPDSRFSYTNQKPWWWDMMNERSQKMWELWNYNWQKALSDSLIKVSTNLAMCLLTGSENGSVSKFLGERGGSPDMECVDPSGKTLGMTWVDYSSTFKGEPGKDSGSSSLSEGVYAEWKKECIDMGGKPQGSSSGDKNALRTRMRCLGMDAKLGWLSKTGYDVNCDSVNQTPLSYSASATRKDGKIRGKQQDKIVVYVKVKPLDSKIDTKTTNQEFIIALEKTNSYSLSREKMAAIGKNCKLTTVGSFKATNSKKKIAKKNAEYNDDENIIAEISKLEQQKKKVSTSEDASFNRDIDNKIKALNSRRVEGNSTAKLGNTTDDTTIDIEIPEYIKGKVIAQYKYCTGENAKPSEFIDEDAVQKDLGVKTESIKTCSVWSDAIVEKVTVNDMDCENPRMASELGKTELASYSVTINKPMGNIFAVFVEYVQGATVGNSGKTGSVVKEIIPVQNAETYNQFVTARNGDKVTYTVTMSPGKDVTSTGSSTTASVPGNGKVFWVMTNKSELAVKPGKVFEEKSLDSVTSTDIVGSGASGRKTAYCYYRWGCNGQECRVADNTEAFCREGSGDTAKLFRAISHKQADGDYLIKKSATPVSAEDIKTIAGKCEQCNGDVKQFVDSQPICSEICKYKEAALNGKFGILPNLKDAKLDANALGISTDVLGEDCPFCNTDSNSEVTVKEGECSFTVTENFNSGKYDKFANDADARASIRRKTESLFKNCIVDANKTSILINVEGYTSKVGGERNEALSMARAITVAEEMYQALNVKVPLIYFYSDTKGTPLNFNYGAGFSNESSYIADFSGRSTDYNTSADNKLESLQTRANDKRKESRDLLRKLENTEKNIVALVQSDNNNENKNIVSDISGLKSKIVAIEKELENNPKDIGLQEKLDSARIELDNYMAELKKSVPQDKQSSFDNLLSTYDSTQVQYNNSYKEYLNARRAASVIHINVVGMGIDKESRGNEHQFRRIEVAIK